MMKSPSRGVEGDVAAYVDVDVEGSIVCRRRGAGGLKIEASVEVEAEARNDREAFTDEGRGMSSGK